MKEITEQEKLDNQKSELIDDLLATASKRGSLEIPPR